MFGENKKKLKILKLSRDVRYLQKVALNALFSGICRSCRDTIKSLSISASPPTTVDELEAQLKKATLHGCYATNFFIDIGKI